MCTLVIHLYHVSRVHLLYSLLDAQEEEDFTSLQEFSQPI